MKKIYSIITLTLILCTMTFSQSKQLSEECINRDTVPTYKFSLSSVWMSITNPFPESVDMYEVHFSFRVTDYDVIAIKACTWKTFKPMGIPLWDPLFTEKSEWYPGKIREYGLGISYQRFLWNGMFASIQIVPLMKIYLDENDRKVEDGFRLYTSYHLGYHISLFNNKFFIEPQIHCNYWPINSKGPQGFHEKESRWNNYFLFEPNLFIGINF